VVPDADVYCRPGTWPPSTRPACLAAARRQAGRQPGLEVDLGHRLEIERLQFAALFATQDQKNRHEQLHGERSGKGRLRGALTLLGAGRPLGHASSVRCDTQDVTEPDDALSLEMVTAALRVDGNDAAIYASVLATSLSEALPRDTWRWTASSRCRPDAGPSGRDLQDRVKLGDQTMTLP